MTSRERCGGCLKSEINYEQCLHLAQSDDDRRVATWTASNFKNGNFVRTADLERKNTAQKLNGRFSETAMQSNFVAQGPLRADTYSGLV